MGQIVNLKPWSLCHAVAASLGLMLVQLFKGIERYIIIAQIVALITK